MKKLLLLLLLFLLQLSCRSTDGFEISNFSKSPNYPKNGVYLAKGTSDRIEIIGTKISLDIQSFRGGSKRIHTQRNFECINGIISIYPVTSNESVDFFEFKWDGRTIIRSFADQHWIFNRVEP